MKNRISTPLKAFLLLFSIIVTLALVSSCKKYTTPNKVSRIIVKDSWRIQSFFFQGNSITIDFASQVFSFEEEGGVLAKGITGNVGVWDVGANKNPAILYLSNFLNYPLMTLNDDWTVDSASKKEIKLSSGENSLSLIKVGN
ncbi:MAG: hypothetical protein COA33_012800 [Fluviicola sp.]|nr:hypothetical protein [Fluviicola sp.]